MFLLKLAFRNILRNRRRTIISVLAISIGLVAMIFTDAISYGYLDAMIKDATSSLSGHAEIHEKSFKDTLNVSKFIKNEKQIEENLKHDSLVKNYTKRVISYGMLSSSDDFLAITVYGVNPATEKNISELAFAIQKGEYLNNNNQNGILISKYLAKKLSVELGDKLVLTVGQANSISQEMFRVSGIFHFGVSQIDKGIVFINIKKAQKILNIQNHVHSIAMTLKSIQDGANKKLGFWTKYSSKDNIIEAWSDFFPQITSMMGMMDFSLLLTALILFILVAVGIINTLFMSIYERTFEFAVLKSLGTRAKNLILLIVLESSILSFISTILGLTIGAGVLWYFTYHGIDYRGLEYGGVTMKHLIYPVIYYSHIFLYSIGLFFFTSMCGLYPAIYVSRLNMVKAIKKLL